MSFSTPASETAAAPLGLLGGTFDPVHRGHLALAHAAMDGLDLAGVRWIPSGTPGHRSTPGATASHRLNMLALALAGETRFSLDRSDALSPTSTYTVHTLERLRQELGPQKPLIFIIGADQLMALNTWREWRQLFQLAHFGVAERPGYPMEHQCMPAELAEELDRRKSVGLDKQAAGRILHFAMPAHDVSATSIRSALAAGRVPADALPRAVLDYIRSHHLYRDSGI